MYVTPLHRLVKAGLVGGKKIAFLITSNTLGVTEVLEIPSPSQRPTALSVLRFRGPAFPTPGPRSAGRPLPAQAPPRPGPSRGGGRSPHRPQGGHASPATHRLFPAEALSLRWPPPTRQRGSSLAESPGSGAGDAPRPPTLTPAPGGGHAPHRGGPGGDAAGRPAEQRVGQAAALPRTPRRSPPPRRPRRAAAAFSPPPRTRTLRPPPQPADPAATGPTALRRGAPAALPPRTHHEHREPPLGTLPGARRARQQQQRQQPQQDGLVPPPPPPGARRGRHPAVRKPPPRWPRLFRSPRRDAAVGGRREGRGGRSRSPAGPGLSPPQVTGRRAGASGACRQRGEAVTGEAPPLSRLPPRPLGSPPGPAAAGGQSPLLPAGGRSGQPRHGGGDAGGSQVTLPRSGSLAGPLPAPGVTGVAPQLSAAGGGVGPGPSKGPGPGGAGAGVRGRGGAVPAAPARAKPSCAPGRGGGGQRAGFPTRSLVRVRTVPLESSPVAGC